MQQTERVAGVSGREASSRRRRSGQDSLRGTPADRAASDWSALFDALRMRLARLADLPEAQATRAGVLECVDALGVLVDALAEERARHALLENELNAARTALGRARVEIVGIRSSERRSRRLALQDELTTLPNRSFFGAWLDQALTAHPGAPQPLAVFFVDLDGFKGVNDTHGHAVGDELLRIVASRLAAAVRVEDVVSRIGGDEFACALTHLPGREHLGQLARKLYETVSAPVRIGGLELAVRPSIGIAMCPADGATAQTLLCRADAAMYHAKRRVTGFAFFDECDGTVSGGAAVGR
jgi:diguanylate cyclase (GGDEF)-like protein